MIDNIYDVTILYRNVYNVTDNEIFYLWYDCKDNNKIQNIKIPNEINNFIEEYFVSSSFDDYILVSQKIIKFILENKKIYIRKKYFVITVVIQKQHELAKKHDPINESGFLTLFSLFLKKKRSKVQLEDISLNLNLIYEKIVLNIGDKDNNNMDFGIDDDLEGSVNDLKCPICWSMKGNLIETPCKHNFHLNCLKYTTKLICPICRNDIKNFLIEKGGMSIEEISKKISIEKKQEELENYYQLLANISLDDISDIDFMRLCMNSLNLKNGNIQPYINLILDFNKVASKLFCEISLLKYKKKGKGIFIYYFDSIVDFIYNANNIDIKSKVKWIYNSLIKNKEIINKISTINYDFNQQYLLVIIIEDIIYTEIINKNDYKKTKLLSSVCLVVTLLKCEEYRCECKIDLPNKEYIWATKKLDKMKNRNQKFFLKHKIRLLN